MVDYGETGTTDSANIKQIDLDQKIVLPSYEEVKDDGWFTSNTAREVSFAEGTNFSGNYWWWLRSPGTYDDFAAFVDNNGGVDPGGGLVASYVGIRPAFRMNLESVIFTSATAGGKSASPDGTSGDGVGSTLSGTKVPVAAETLKFTIQDDESQELNVAGITKVSNKTNELQFHYSGATTGENQYISCVLVKGEGESSVVEYYGKLEKKPEGSSDAGTVTISLRDVENGDYTLKIFSEQDNGDYYTDYAGSIHEYKLSVAGEKGEIGGGLGSDSGLKVYYGHNGMINDGGGEADTNKSPIAWRIMDETTDAYTLMSDKLLGYRQYNAQMDHKVWSGSDIAIYLNDSRSGGFIGESFDKREEKHILKYGTTETTNGHEDIDISQKIVLPSVEEVNGKWFKQDAAGNEDRKAYYGENVNGVGSGAAGWWLRSPGFDDNEAAFVLSDGGVHPGGVIVIVDLGIRPAFRLNLESVIFSSAAEGGKSATVGSDLVGMTVPTDGIKLTIQDENVDAPVITMESDAEAEVLTFQYSGTIPDGYQYISCILADENGEALYYGKLAEPDTGQDQGDFDLSAANIPEGTYTLKIFWEECHGKYETDYASQAVERKLTVADGEGSVEDLVPPVIETIEPEHETEEVPVSGKIIITFNETMDTDHEGEVKLTADSLPESLLTGGIWSNENCTYTVEYDDLEYGTEYSIEVSGFHDAAKNVMRPDNAHTFTTEQAAIKPTIDKNLDDNITLKVGDTAALEVEVNDPADGGALSYQWYSNTAKEEETGEKIQGANQASYELPTDKSGILYYYVVITNTKKNKNKDDETEASITSNIIQVKIQEKTPQATIDYEAEQLTGLEPGKYLFGANAKVIPDDETTYPIDSDWMTGEELEIIKKSSTSGCDSDVQKLTIPMRPVVPNVTGVNTSGESKSDGKIIGTDAAMQYSTDEGATWLDCPFGDMENLSAGGYQIRIKASNTSENFSGEIKTVIVGTAVHAEKPDILIHPQNAIYGKGELANELSVIVKELSDQGVLSYQWCSSSENSTEHGTALEGETTPGYQPSTAEVGIQYYYVVVTNTNNMATGEKTAETVSDIAEVKVKEKTPQVGIDYEKEQLSGMESGSYLVGADSKEILVNGTIYTIDAAWMTGNALTIIRKSTVAECNSDAQSLVIPKRPDAPKVDSVDASVQGSADGKITDTSTAMEYSADNGKSWKPCKGTTVDGLSAGEYLIRVRADNEKKTFYGESAIVTIGEGAVIPDSRLSVESITFDTITEGSARPAAKNIVISNQGGQDVQIREVTVSGSTFVILSSDRKTVPAGGSNTAWQIQPAEKLSAGLYQETVTVTDSNQKIFTATVSIRVNQILEMEGNAVVGTAFKITPSAYDSTGTWNYDNHLLSAEIGEGYAVFTPILDGETEIIYQSGSGVTGRLKLTIEKGKLTGIAAKGWSGKYDGEPHAITLSGVPEGASVEYSVDSGASWQKQNPSYTEEGTEVTVQYRVTKAGYEPAAGQAVIKIGDCEHQWSDWKETKAASCKATGEQQRECQICKEIQIKELPSPGHSWGEEQIEPATCEKNGYTYRLCRNCDEVQHTGVLIKLPHEYGDWEVTKQAGCGTEGSERRTCINCGYTEDRSIPATGDHELGDWYTAKTPTEQETGLRKRDCKNCDYQEAEVIEKLGALVMNGLPENNKITVGKSFTLVPSDDSRKGSDGWNWDPEYFDATFNSPATFTAKKTGKTDISYTAEDGRVLTISLSIEEALGETKETETETETTEQTETETKKTPTKLTKETGKSGKTDRKSNVKTGDSSTAMLLLLLLMTVSGVTGIAVYAKKNNH